MTSARSIRALAAEQCVLDALRDGPKSIREIADTTIAKAREAWATRHGYEVEWGTSHEPLGARLLAWHEAEKNGLVSLHSHQVDSVVRRLERQGRVSRIQIEGQRPMLWVAT